MDAFPQTAQALPGEATVDVRAVKAIISRRGVLAVSVFGLVFGAVVAVTWTQRPTYQAEVALLVNKETRPAGAVEIPGLEEMATFGPRTVETQSRLLANPDLYQQAAADIGAEPAAIGLQWRVDNPKNTDTLVLQVQADNPQAAADIANKAAELHIEKMQTGSQNATHRAVVFIEGQLEQVREQLTQTEEALQVYKEAHGVADVPAEIVNRTNAVSALSSQAATASAERAGASTLAANYRQQLAGQEETRIESSTIARNPIVQQMESELATLELQRAQQITTRGDAHPEVRQLDDRIAEARKKLSDAMATVISAEVKTTNPLYLDIATALATAEANARAAQARESALNSVVARERSQLGQMPAVETDFSRLQRDASVTQDTYTTLLQKCNEMRIQEAMIPPIVEVVTSADPPTSPSKPRKSLNLAIGLVLGIILAAMAVGAAEVMDDAIRTSWQAQAALDLPSLGVIPKVARGQELLTADRPNPRLADAFRTLRTNLRFSAPGGMPKVILVTSPRRGDGKTTVVANLGAALAQTGLRTLIVDADMRKAELHERVGVPNETGLSNILTGQANPMVCIRETGVPNLLVCPAGPEPPNPVDLLDSEMMKNTLGALRDQFDAVIIDTSSCDYHADPVVLAPFCDAYSLVVQVGATSIRVARGAVAKLDRTECRAAGMIANGIKLPKRQ